jgi:hypothetical protein
MNDLVSEYQQYQESSADESGVESRPLTGVTDAAQGAAALL